MCLICLYSSSKACPGQCFFTTLLQERMWKDAGKYRLFLFSPALCFKAGDVSLAARLISDCPSVSCNCLRPAENGFAFSFISLGWREDVQTWVLLTMPTLGIICFNISTLILFCSFAGECGKLYIPWKLLCYVLQMALSFFSVNIMWLHSVSYPWHAI